jgi:hypothetical protein
MTERTRYASKTRGRSPRLAAHRRHARHGSSEAGEIVDLLEERMSHPETGPILTGGDVDADWEGAASSGEEGVGGSAPTPDQAIVDEIGRALGLEQPSDSEVYTSEEILAARHRHYWHLERKAADEERDATEDEDA